MNTENKNSKNIGIIIALAVTGICLVLCCLVAGVVVWQFQQASTPGAYDNTSLSVGEIAPDFELQLLSGETARLSDFRGQPVLLTFGATWCPDCRLEVPLVNQLHEEYPELVILLVDSKEERAIVQPYVEKMGITHPVLLDLDGKVSELYKIYFIPTNLFIDSEGVIRAKLIETSTRAKFAEKLPAIGIQP